LLGSSPVYTLVIVVKLHQITHRSVANIKILDSLLCCCGAILFIFAVAVTARYALPMLLPQDNATFAAGWLSRYLNIIVLWPLAALLCWDHVMLLLPSPPVYCCHFHILLLSLSPLAPYADADTESWWWCLCRQLIVANLILYLLITCCTVMLIPVKCC